jgi:Mrp family chromosome partitioning ATPase
MGEGKAPWPRTWRPPSRQLGRDVVLISADLRFPRVHTVFGLGNDRGSARS